MTTKQDDRKKTLVIAQKRWPKGIPADPMQAVHALKLKPTAFEGEMATSDARGRWMIDGHIMVDLSNRSVDTALVDRLRGRISRKDNRSASDVILRDFVVRAHGSGRWPVHPIALFRYGSEKATVTLRFALPDGQPVLEVNADLLRLVDACVGGADAFSWHGLGGATAPLLHLERGGRTVGFLMGLMDVNQSYVLPIEKEIILAGHDGPPPEVSPAWELPKGSRSSPPNDLEASLEHVTEFLGGTSTRNGSDNAFTKIVPTRAGPLRLGIVGGRLTGVFVEPLRAMRMVGFALGGTHESPPGKLLDSGLVQWWGSQDFKKFFVDNPLAQRPVDRPSHAELVRAPSASVYGPAYEMLMTLSADGTYIGRRILDIQHGSFLRGIYPAVAVPNPRLLKKDMVRDLTDRLTTSKGLRFSP